ncbi:PAS domain S-box protein [Leptolyngbya sp. FACHB-671]|uniref:PAS domain S-box protein n=1 Tax=Leptolyngbya sp. FACHB-671 TaxID=2692812 RepID=UPI001685D06A|nr:PAS domain S-box protein [Leptolyngbya sp. FACHB-671]MBD2070125.1 PAS domain S-box protein [Leptolyngbya sp. FACHB-671]
MLSKMRHTSPYAVAVLSVVVATVLTQLLYSLIASVSFSLFYAAIAISTWIGGTKPGLLATLLSLLSSDYFFLPSASSLPITDPARLLRLSLIAIVSFLINYLISELRNARHQIQQISDRRLQERKEQLRLAMHAARMGMWNWNLITGEITWSPEHEQLLNFAPNTFDGRFETFEACVHPHDREKLNQAVQTAIQEHSIYKHEYRIFWRDGSVHWVEGRGQAFYDKTDKPVRMSGTLMDVDDRKRLELALKQSEQQFRAIFEAEPECVKVITADGILQNMNPAGLAMIEADSLEQVLGQCICPLIELAQQQAFLEFTQQVARGKTTTLEFEITGLKGTRRWLESHAVPLHTSNETSSLVLAVTRDVTERKQAEAAVKQLNAELERRVAERTAELQRTSNLLNNFFNAASSAAIGLCIHDQGLRFIQINEALAAIDGHSVEAHLGKTATELLPELAPVVTPLHQQVLTTGQPILDMEIATAVPSQPEVIRHWLASYFPILDDDSQTQTVGVGVIVTEISDRKRAEAILVEADRRWHFLLDNVQLIVVGLDQDGNVEYINPFFLKLTGYTKEEVLGKYWFNHFLPSSQKSTVQICFQEVLEQGFHPHYQNSIVTKLGEERMIAWNNTLLQNAEGKSIGTISIGEDITERHNLDQMKAEFISIVSHELRTPLTSISGALELLSTGLIQPESERGKETLSIAAAETDRLTRLVNDILDLERLESGKIRLEQKSWNLAELMNRAADFMQLAATQAAITLSVEPLSVTLQVDGDRILQVLTNLLSNAVKFSPAHSTIWLTAEICKEAQTSQQAETNQQAKQPLQTFPPYILITVRDQGRGIPTNKLESIFERFQQVDASDSRKKGGTGLGLAICQSIVQQHGGDIWATSSLDQGSSLHFTLPFSAEN